MKYFLSIATLSFLFVSSVSAMCLYEETEPMCAITGKTFRSTCEGWSDTSAWHILIAYEGECQQIPDIGENKKQAIYDFMDVFYKEHKMYDTQRAYYNVLNSEGISFTQFKLFPKIQQIISEEIQKESPDFHKIALLNYVAQIVGYDYEIRKPE